MSPGNTPVEPSRFRHAFHLEVVAFATVFFPNAANVSSKSFQSQSHFNAGFSEPVTCSTLGGTATSPLTPSRTAAEPATCQGCSLYRLRPQRFPGVRLQCWRRPSLPFPLVPVTTPNALVTPLCPGQLFYVSPIRL